MLRVAFAGVLLLADLAAFTWLARAGRRRPLPLAAAVGLGLLVSWEAVVVELLSPFGAVSGASLAVAASLPPAAVLALVWRRPGGLRAAWASGWRGLRWTARAGGWPGLLVLPLAVVLAAVAAAYAPSNWDSMTYHLARVAHWIQRGSVAPYVTNVERQIYLPPGAEYVLLALQAIAGSDRLAAFLQYVAWLLVVGAAPALARLAGAPRRIARWAAPIVAGAPMLVLQATSTQNDLVAAALAIALVAGATPFLRPRAAGRPADLALLATTLVAALLVKVTAVLAALPFLVVALPGLLRGARRGPMRSWGLALAASLLVAAVAAGPQAYRVVTSGGRATAIAAPFVFPIVGEWEARGANLRAAVVRHLPAGPDLVPDLMGRPAVLPPFHEDLASNPVQFVAAAVGLAFLLLPGRRLAARARWAGAGYLVAWLLFQWHFRSNPWISRLETPLFALMPLTCAGWSALRPRVVGESILGVVAAASLLLGVAAALHDVPRPVAGILSARTEADDYYVNRRDPRVLHDAALDVAARIGCRRMGLLVTEDSYDYPLTWRAMQRGAEVRHVLGPDPWPCLLVSDRGPPPEGVAGGPPWQPVILLKAGPAADATVMGGVWVRRP